MNRPRLFSLHDTGLELFRSHAIVAVTLYGWQTGVGIECLNLILVGGTYKPLHPWQALES